MTRPARTSVHPVRQERDPRCVDGHRHRRRPAPTLVMPRRRRSDRADTHGAARRKGVIGLARAWNAMTAAMILPIRPLLVDHPLQRIRAGSRRTHAGRTVIGLSTRMTIAIPGRQPKSGRIGEPHVFIGSPRCRSRAGRSTAGLAFRAPPGHPLVELCRGELPHRAIVDAPLPGHFPKPSGSREPNVWKSVGSAKGETPERISCSS